MIAVTLVPPSPLSRSKSCSGRMSCPSFFTPDHRIILEAVLGSLVEVCRFIGIFSCCLEEGHGSDCCLIKGSLATSMLEKPNQEQTTLEVGEPLETPTTHTNRDRSSLDKGLKLKKYVCL